MTKTKKTYELDEQTVGVIEGMAKLFGITEKSIVETAICQPQVLITMEVIYLKSKGE